MYRLFPLAVLAAVALGCGKAPDAGAPKPDDPKFDPASAENTLEWAKALWRETDKVPERVGPVLDEAEEKARAAVQAGAVGRTVR